MNLRRRTEPSRRAPFDGNGNRLKVNPKSPCMISLLDFPVLRVVGLCSSAWRKLGVEYAFIAATISINITPRSDRDWQRTLVIGRPRRLRRRGLVERCFCRFCGTRSSHTLTQGLRPGLTYFAPPGWS